MSSPQKTALEERKEPCPAGGDHQINMEMNNNASIIVFVMFAQNAARFFPRYKHCLSELLNAFMIYPYTPKNTSTLQKLTCSKIQVVNRLVIKRALLAWHLLRVELD
jgi:hypothetical protein